MKKTVLVVLALFALVRLHADTLVWTNTAGGTWSDATSWNPNGVPGPGDDAVITNSGNYTVTLDVNGAVGSLTLGGATGQQMLDTAGNELAPANPSQINTNGFLELSGGILGGPGPLVVQGQIDWTGGRVNGDGVVTIAANGVLTVNANGGFLDLAGVVTNAGTVVITNGQIRCIIYGGYGPSVGLLVNSPSGIIDLETDGSLGFYTDHSSPTEPGVMNAGLLRKSSGTDTAVISSLFFSSGTVEVETGTLSLQGGGSGTGVYQADAGATLEYRADYEVDGTMAGAGTNLLDGGVLTFNGSIAGRLNWIGGRMDATGNGTVAAGGLMWVNPGFSGSELDSPGALTNWGTIVITNGGLRCLAFSGYGVGSADLINAAGGLIDLESGGFIDYYNDNTGGTPVVINNGTVRKSSGADESVISAPFYNSGTVDAIVGGISLNGGGSGNGVFAAEAGGTLDFAGDYEVDSALTGAGTNVVSNGTLVLNGVWGTTNAVLTGNAVLDGTNVIATQLEWNYFGRIGSTAVVTVATNAVVTVGGSGSQLDMAGTLTNNGTLLLTNGGMRCIVYQGYGGGQGVLVNAAGGVILLQTNSSIGIYDDNTGTADPVVVNQGLVRKADGTDTAAIDAPFYNLGTLDAQTGIISLNGVYDLTGGTLNFGISSLTNYGQINLAGSATLTGTVSAVLNNGYQPRGGDLFPVLSYGSATGIFTDATLPFADAWQTNYDAAGFSLLVLNARPVLAAVTNQTVNELTTLLVTNIATDVDLPPQQLVFSLPAPPTGMTIGASSGIVSWTPAQTQSPATNVISVVVTDSGTPALSATNSFTVVVKEVNVAPSLPVIASQTINELTLLTVTNTATNFNIHSVITGYSLSAPPAGLSISTNGIITWTPAQTQSPGTNLVTTIVTNNNPYDLIHPRLLSTNQFLVVVREVNQPATLPVIPIQTVNELTLLTVTNTATNSNIHSTNSGYGLLTAPAGMSISASGVITWTPAQTQSPATNLVTTVITNGNPYDVVNPRLTTTNSFTVVVKEVNVAPSLPVIATQIVNELTLLSVTNSATNFNIHSTITGYRLVNAPTGMAVSAAGVITWTPAQSQSPGTNLITTVVTNSNPYDLVNPVQTSTNQFSVVVREVNQAPVLPVVAAQTINELALLSVTNGSAEANIHSTLTYALINPPTGMSISASGLITWTPTRAQAPATNVITTVATSSNPYDLVNPVLKATNTFTVTVFAPVLAAIGDYSINPGQTVTFTNMATDNDRSQTLTFSMTGQPSGATLGASTGIFKWRPTTAQAGSVNTIQIVVTDKSTPALTDTKSFTVTVGQLAPVTLTPLGYANGQFTVQVNGTTGPDYIISVSTNVTQWADIHTNLAPTTPFIYGDTNAGASAARYYRARLSP